MKLRASLFGLFVALQFATHAYAQSPKRPATPSLSETLQGDAKEAYEEARRLFKAGEFKTSLASLLRAHSLSPDPRLYWNMAACEKKLGHHAKAVSYVEKYLASGGSVLSEEERRDAAEFLAAARTLVGTVTVTSAEAGARDRTELSGVELYVDDELIGTTPFQAPILIDGGERRVRVRRPGYKESARAERVPAGGAATWVLELERDVHEGRVVVSSAPEESIWLDGKLVGRGEWGGAVATGKHTVLVTAPGKKSREQAVELADNEVKTLDLHLQSASGGSTWLWIGGGVLVAAGLGVGGYLLFKPKNDEPAPTRGTLGTFTFP